LLIGILFSMQSKTVILVTLLLMLATGIVVWNSVQAQVADVDQARMLAADDDGRNWMSWGRTYSEQRFSPLDQIDEDTVSELGLAWYYDLNTFRGVEGTPIVVDGV